MNEFEIGFGIVLLLVVGFLIYKNKEKIIESLEKRIEKNAIKVPNVIWIDGSGNTHTEDIVIKRSRLPLIGDWARVYPAINENGKVNWVNTIFGGRKNFIRLLILLGIIGLFFLAMREAFSNYNTLKEFCEPYLSLT